MVGVRPWVPPGKRAGSGPSLRPGRPGEDDVYAEAMEAHLGGDHPGRRGALLIPALQGGATYYLTIGEALAKEEAQPGQRFRIAGNVTPGSIVDQPTDFRLSFLMEDEGGQVPVVYHGARPDNLQDGSGVVVEGRFHGETFHAETLMVQSASKYEAAEGAEHPAEIPKGRDR